MSKKDDISSINSSNYQDFQKRSAKCTFSQSEFVVPGAGFERQVERASLHDRVLQFLNSNGSASLRKICEGVNEQPTVVVHCLRRLWKKELILRTAEPVYEFETCQKGRAGLSCHVRAVNYYVLNNGHKIAGRFVKYDDRKKDGRSKEVESKASRILRFLESNRDKAFYSVDIRKAVEVKSPDIMTNVRRFERKGLVYVRGYQSHDRRSPFSKGFIITWIDQEKSRDNAIRDAFERTNKVLTENPTSNTIHERIRLIRDQLLTTNELLSLTYIRNVLNCPIDKARQALRRAKQLYPDINEVKIFDKFTYYYLDSMKPEDLHSNVELKKNYIRVRYGRNNRIGHNWEAVVEWFIDKFTEGAEFVTQTHRRKMDSRRITLHLLKPVGDRKQSAEVDRVWKVTPGLFSPTVIYVLECKWSAVTKKTLDDFLDVLKWSTDFGVDTENGRELKKGIVPVFGAGAYNPKEKVTVNGQKITLAQYAARMNIKLLRPADFNAKLRELGVEKKITVQKVCRVSKNEKDVRVVLEEIWKNPLKAQEILDLTLDGNQQVFEFERELVQK